MKVKSESKVAQSCPTLSNPMDCGLPGSSIHGILQSRVLEWVVIAFSKSYTTLWKYVMIVFFGYLNALGNFFQFYIMNMNYYEN